MKCESRGLGQPARDRHSSSKFIVMDADNMSDTAQ